MDDDDDDDLEGRVVSVNLLRGSIGIKITKFPTLLQRHLLAGAISDKNLREIVMFAVSRFQLIHFP